MPTSQSPPPLTRSLLKDPSTLLGEAWPGQWGQREEHREGVRGAPLTWPHLAPQPLPSASSHSVVSIFQPPLPWLCLALCAPGCPLLTLTPHLLHLHACEEVRRTPLGVPGQLACSLFRNPASPWNPPSGPLGSRAPSTPLHTPPTPLCPQGRQGSSPLLGVQQAHTRRLASTQYLEFALSQGLLTGAWWGRQAVGRWRTWRGPGWGPGQCRAPSLVCFPVSHCPEESCQGRTAQQPRTDSGQHRPLDCQVPARGRKVSSLSQPDARIPTTREGLLSSAGML